MLILTFYGNVNILTRLDERNSMTPEFVTALFSSKVICGKKAQNGYFDLSWPVLPNSLMWGRYWCNFSERAVEKLLSVFFCILLPAISSEIMTHFQRQITFRYIWPSMKSENLNNELNCFPMYSLRAIAGFYAFLYLHPCLIFMVSLKKIKT